MTCYPLLFARRELVEGNGFVARVAVSGRALLTDEEGEVWVEGINPGGFAANGKSHSEAFSEFGAAFRAVLLDIAAGAKSFEAFRAEAHRFSAEANVPALRDWEEAVQQVRAGRLDAECAKQEIPDLR
jgi:hypothetical protein